MKRANGIDVGSDAGRRQDTLNLRRFKVFQLGRLSAALIGLVSFTNITHIGVTFKPPRRFGRKRFLAIGRSRHAKRNFANGAVQR